MRLNATAQSELYCNFSWWYQQIFQLYWPVVRFGCFFFYYLGIVVLYHSDKFRKDPVYNGERTVYKNSTVIKTMIHKSQWTWCKTKSLIMKVRCLRMRVFFCLHLLGKTISRRCLKIEFRIDEGRSKSTWCSVFFLSEFLLFHYVWKIEGNSPIFEVCWSFTHKSNPNPIFLTDIEKYVLF